MRKSSFLSSKSFRIVGDFAINILSSVIYTFARQIVVFPLLAARLSDGDYGTLLTVAGLANVCTSMVGSSLNNIRLIQNSRYEEQEKHGDFNLLCLFGAGISCVFSLVLWRIFGYSGLTALLLTAYILVSNLYHYASAFFRLELNFKRNLTANIVVSCAYIAATPLFATSVLWPLVFLIGEGVGLLYTGKTTRFYREPLGRTPLWGETSKKLIVFILLGVVGNFLTYADRMILYPLLGPESVSYYSTASFFGKSAGIVMTPIAGVLLGYFSQKNFTASKRLFTLINGASILCLCIFLAGCWLFAPWFTELLYPSLYAQAEPYIMLASLGSAIGIAGNMANPMILKCCNTHWLLIVQLIQISVYLGSALYLLPLYGLLGFCWSTIFSGLARLLALYGLGYWKL